MRSSCAIIFLFALALQYAEPLNAGRRLDSLSNHSETRSMRVGQNFRIHPSGVTQTEAFITRHPTDANILFASAFTFNPSTGFISEGVYVSTNAGTTWGGSDTCNGAPITFHRGEPGVAIDKNGTFLLVRFGFTAGVYSHFSTDNGRTWSSQRTIATNDQDQASLISDDVASSPLYGRSYAAWVRLGATTPVQFSYTDNGGSTWSAPAQVNSPTQRCTRAEISIGANGRVNLCWAGVINVSPFTEDFIGFATSSNGGASWTVRENAFDVNGIQGTLAAKGNIRVNGVPKMDTDKTGGVRNGWIYVVTTEKNLAPAGGDPDIILHRSTDHGQTWAPGIRVNQDALNNGKTQFFPAIEVDDFGGVNVLYCDDRNTTSDSAGISLSRSTDGGNTWTDHRVSDHHYKPAPVSGLGFGSQGDNIGLTSLGTTLWPVWMDNSSGLYQIWTSPIGLTSLDVERNDEAAPTKFALSQNYPNPFNPTTKMSFVIGHSSLVSLNVYDVLGREVATLVNEKLGPGNHERAFDAGGLPSGVYFYRLIAQRVESSTGEFVSTRKMLLIR